MRNSKNKPSSRSTRKTSKKSAPSKIHPPPNTVREPPLNHLVYFLNIMAETRISSYFVVASDTTSIFKTSTEQICDCIGKWKSRETKDLLEILRTPDADPPTLFGANVVRIGEILGALQAEDPIAFSSNIQMETILGSVIPLAKDVVKLKRKLLRISDSVMPDLKNLRTLLELHGLLSNSGDHEVDVNEDFGNYVESVTDSAMEMLPQKLSKETHDVNKGCPRLIYLLQNIFSRNKSPEHAKSKSSKNTNKLKTQKSKGNNSVEAEIKPPSERSSEKHLQKIASTLATQKHLASVEYILDPADARVKEAPDEQEQAELWKRLEPQPKQTVDALHSVCSPLVVEELNDDEVRSIFEQEAIKCFPRQQLPFPHHFQFEPSDMVVAVSETSEPQNNGPIPHRDQEGVQNGNNAHLDNSNESETGRKLGEDLDDCVEALDSIGITFVDNMGLTASMSKLISESGYQNKHHNLFLQHDSTKKRTRLSEYRILVGQMHQTVSETIDQIRYVEQDWMTTSTKAAGFSNFLKIQDMLDYIRQTIGLLSDHQFIQQIYPETKRNMLKVLDPVYREFHSCFIALGELAETVATDAIYLKQLIENLPRGDPIVYEFTSNSSLGSFDQIENAADVPARSFVFDVEAIFA